jgi:hypothetical protein
MTIIECDVPVASVLDRRMVEAAYFHDAYRAPLSQRRASIVDLFFGVLGHHPMWLKLILVVRNRIASVCGLDVPTVSEIMRPVVKSSYRVGDKIGPWPIFSLSETELVAGRDNKHLDFRLSVLKESNANSDDSGNHDGESASVVISTICTTHNIFGKVYLFFIIPFHKWGVRRLIANAIASGRL